MLSYDDGTPIDPPLSPASSIGLPLNGSSPLRMRRPRSPLGGMDASLRARDHSGYRAPTSDMYRRFLDLDVMKSVADLNSKPKLKSVTVKKEFTRLLLFPAYALHWKTKLSRVWMLTILYLVQLAVCVVYFKRGSEDVWQDICPAEIYFPPLLLLVVSIAAGRTPTVECPEETQVGMKQSREVVFAESISDSGDSSSTFDEEEEQKYEKSSDFLLPTFEKTHSSAMSDLSESRGDDAFRAAAEDDALRVDAVNVLLWKKIREADQQLTPFKLAMPIMEIRNAIQASVESAEVLPYSTIPTFSAFLFALMPTARRTLLNGTIFYGAVDSMFEWLTPVSDDGSCSSQLTDFTRMCIEHPAHATSLNASSVAAMLLHPGSHRIHNQEDILLMMSTVVVTAISVFFLTRFIIGTLFTAQRTYHKRYLYAKYFSALTSLRRSQRYNLPHFRLKNVENVMAWLSLRGSRAWLRLEPNELSADMVVSLTFQFFLAMVATIGWIVLQEGTAAKISKTSVSVEDFDQLSHGQIFFGTLILSYYLLHFMMIGTAINHKYGNSTLLLTEQINLHLRMVAVSERPSHYDTRGKEKKEKLLLCNKVLELAAKLLKELEGPNKVCGHSISWL